MAPAVVLTVALASCSAGRPGAGSEDLAGIVRDAASRTGATAARVTVVGAGPARGRDVRTTGTGLIDPAHRAATLDLTVDPVGPVQARVLGSTAYAALPPRAVGDIARGRAWVSVELPAVDRGLFADTLVQLGTGVTGNPADGFALLAAVRDVRVAAAETASADTVGGRPATRYTGTVDLARAAATTPALSPVLERFSADVPLSELPVEVWIDPAGRVSRLVEHLSPTATSTLDVGDPVAPPEITAPPATRVTNLLESLRP